jgi:hypothetical protein
MRRRRASRLAVLLAFAAVVPLGIALGQTAPGSIVSDLPVASGTKRVLFLGAQGARALVVLLPGSDGIIGLDSGGGVHQFGGNLLARTIGQWVAQGFDVVLPDAPNGTSLLGQRTYRPMRRSGSQWFAASPYGSTARASISHCLLLTLSITSGAA